jgi:hypothetical protein
MDRPSAARPDEPAAGALDVAALARLSDLDPSGCNGLVARVLHTYAVSLERLSAELRQARATGDPATVRRVAHTLKSSSASIGALALAALCAQVESAARQPVAGHVQALLDEFDAESQRVARPVRARLGPARGTAGPSCTRRSWTPPSPPAPPCRRGYCWSTTMRST